MTTITKDWLAEYAADAKRRRDRLPTAKAALLAALKRTRAAMFRSPTTAKGDGGQITDIRACNATTGPSSCAVPCCSISTEPPRRYENFHEALDAFAWAVLDFHHDGFENNEGGFGTIDIDVAEGHRHHRS